MYGSLTGKDALMRQGQGPLGFLQQAMQKPLQALRSEDMAHNMLMTLPRWDLEAMSCHCDRCTYR